MYDMLVSGHYPAINEFNIPRDVTIQIYLNKEIDTTSVKYNNIIVTDYLYKPVKGDIGWQYTNNGTPSGIANILTFTPSTFFDPETTYFVTIPKYPDSVKAIDDSWLQQSYSYRFNTGVGNNTNNVPTTKELLEMELAAAIAREDWCTAAAITARLSGLTSACGIPLSGTLPDLPKNLILLSTYPKNMTSNIPLEELKFIKLTFNDIMPSSGIDYSYYIDIITQDVLE